MRSDILMVQRVLREKGTTAYSFRKITSDGFLDPSNPSKGPISTFVDYTMQSFPGSADMVRGFMFGQKTDTLIAKEDIFLIVDPSSLEVIPDQADEVVRDSRVYKIKKIFSFEVSDVVVLYVIQIRL